MTYTQPVPLRSEHDLGTFDAGEQSLTAWVHRYARHAEAAKSARVFVTTAGDPIVVGYYALTVGRVEPDRGTPRLAKGQPHGRPIPVAILARLAVDQAHQGRGLGRSLLQDAMLRCADAAQQVGIRALVVHAHEEAVGFYRKFGFETSPTDPFHLVRLMKDIEAFLADLARSSA
jgi:GNAT superfamily N-acetyltransferase